MLLDGSDYVGGTEYIDFSASETRACGRFSIVNNNVHEQFEETFSVCIDWAPPGVDTTSGNTTTTVAIHDDDSELGTNIDTTYHVSYSLGRDRGLDIMYTTLYSEGSIFN